MQSSAGLISIIVVGLALSSCSPEPRQACQPPRAYWRTPHNYLGLMPSSNDVSITHDGVIYWNGKPISQVTLDKYLGLSHSMNPEPEVFLQAEMGVSCKALEAVRDRMDDALECKKAYPSCAEGLRSVWRELPTPPRTPAS